MQKTVPRKQCCFFGSKVPSEEQRWWDGSHTYLKAKYLKQENNKINKTNNPHKILVSQKMTVPPLNFSVTPSSPSAPFGRRGPAHLPGQPPKLSRPGTSHPCRVRQVPAPALPSSKSGRCRAGPGGGGLCPAEARRDKRRGLSRGVSPPAPPPGWRSRAHLTGIPHFEWPLRQRTRTRQWKTFSSA